MTQITLPDGYTLNLDDDEVFHCVVEGLTIMVTSGQVCNPSQIAKRFSMSRQNAHLGIKSESLQAEHIPSEPDGTGGIWLVRPRWAQEWRGPERVERVAA